MNTTSVKIKFRKSLFADREGTLYYQVTHNRTVRQIGTNYRLYPNEWHKDEENIILDKSCTHERIIYLHGLAAHIRNDKLRFAKIISELDNEGLGYTAEEVVTRYNALATHQSFKIYIGTIIKQLRDQGRIRTSETYLAAQKSFINFHNGRDICWDDFTPQKIKQYEGWLKTKGASANTISFYMRILRAVYNRAVYTGLTADLHPFRKVYTGVSKTTKRGISTEDIYKILQLDLSAFPSRAFARDIFMFSFYTRGMSLIDIANLTTDHIQKGILTYQRSKTGQRISVKWRKEMQNIVDRHHLQGSHRLLPIIKYEKESRKQYDTALHNINYNLKQIGESIGLSIPLTMYVARHSWASAASRNNVPLHVISHCLGHESEHTTQIYLSSIDVNQMDDATEKIIRMLNKRGRR